MEELTHLEIYYVPKDGNNFINDVSDISLHPKSDKTLIPPLTIMIDN
jgi:hypothetical protein